MKPGLKNAITLRDLLRDLCMGAFTSARAIPVMDAGFIFDTHATAIRLARVIDCNRFTVIDAGRGPVSARRALQTMSLHVKPGESACSGTSACSRDGARHQEERSPGRGRCHGPSRSGCLIRIISYRQQILLITRFYLHA